MLSIKKIKYYALALGLGCFSQANLNSMGYFWTAVDHSFKEDKMNKAFSDDNYSEIYKYYYVSYNQCEETQKAATVWLEKSSNTSAPLMYLLLRLRSKIITENGTKLINQEPDSSLALAYTLLSLVLEDIALAGQDPDNHPIYNAYLRRCNEKIGHLADNTEIKIKSIELAKNTLSMIDALENNRKDFFWVLKTNLIKGYFKGDRIEFDEITDHSMKKAKRLTEIGDPENILKIRKAIREVFFKNLENTLPKK